MSPSPRDRWIPWYFVAFFVVIALINAVMVTLAMRSQPGLVTDHPYEKGLAYNETLEASRRQDALGWHAEISFEHTLPQKGYLNFTMHDKENNPLECEKASAHFFRPTQEKLDFDLALSPVSIGHFALSVQLPSPGIWDVRIDTECNATPYQISKRIVTE